MSALDTGTAKRSSAAPGTQWEGEGEGGGGLRGFEPGGAGVRASASASAWRELTWERVVPGLVYGGAEDDGDASIRDGPGEPNAPSLTERRSTERGGAEVLDVGLTPGHDLETRGAVVRAEERLTHACAG